MGMSLPTSPPTPAPTLAAGEERSPKSGQPGPGSGSVPHVRCGPIGTLPPAPGQKPRLGGHSVARGPDSTESPVRGQGGATGRLCPRPWARPPRASFLPPGGFQLSQRFWAPPTFISFPAVAWGLREAGLPQLWPVPGRAEAEACGCPKSPDTMWVRSCLSVGGVCTALPLGRARERNSPQTLLHCLGSLLCGATLLPRPSSSPLLSAMKGP